MFGRFFSKSTQTDLPYEIYGGLVALARNPVLYTELQVPDTINGRYDMMVMVMFLLAHRLKDSGESCKALSQELFDTFLLDMDRGLREEGVGDTIVPKRLKKMTEVYYGRIRAYELALEQGDIVALGDAVNRNVYPDQPDVVNSARLANYMLRMYAHLQQRNSDQLLRGQVDLGNVEPVLATN